MPIYEYECDNNGHRFEKWQSIQDEPIKTCPECGSTVHKVFHAAGIIFKGSGWYITDSRKSPEKSSNTTSSSDASKGSTGPASEDKTKNDKASSEKKE